MSDPHSQGMGNREFAGVAPDPDERAVAEAVALALVSLEARAILRFRGMGKPVDMLVRRAVEWVAGPAGHALEWSSTIQHLLPEVDRLLTLKVAPAGVAALVTACARAVRDAGWSVRLARRGGGRGRRDDREMALTPETLAGCLSRIRARLGGRGAVHREASRRALAGGVEAVAEVSPLAAAAALLREAERLHGPLAGAGMKRPNKAGVVATGAAQKGQVSDANWAEVRKPVAEHGQDGAAQSDPRPQDRVALPIRTKGN